MIKYLITGTGRSGTVFMAKVFSGVGIPCGHEMIFTTWGESGLADRLRDADLAADSSWMAAPFLDRLEGVTVIHLVRHPRLVVNSLLRMGFFTREDYAGYRLFMHNQLLSLEEFETPLEKAVHFYIEWNRRIEKHSDFFHRVEDNPGVLLDQLGIDYDPERLFNKTDENTFLGENVDTELGTIPERLRTPLVKMMARYGYLSWGSNAPSPENGMEVVKAIITTVDNLPMLKEQVRILRDDPLVSEIVVVNNGSEDGTGSWLSEQHGLTVVNRPNMGAGPGRNAGLDAASDFDYVLMLDGGIRPLRNGVAVMKKYLEDHSGVDVVSPEVATCYTTDANGAHRRLVKIGAPFVQRDLSGTAYALCRRRAWDGIRFSEEGPFGQPGWGVDDNEMQYRWNEAGIVHHDFRDTKLLRRASGSFDRLFRETGVWPNQYGSVYEQRLVLLNQLYPQYTQVPWHKNRIDVSCVVLGWNEFPMFTQTIKRLHEDLRDIPHEIIFVDNGSDDKTKWWLDTFALRWPWGDTTIDAETGEILRRADHEGTWTGNVIRVDLPENMGTGCGYNEGFARARGKYIFHISGDILPVVGSVSALKEYLDAHDDVDYIGVNPWVCQDKDKDPSFEGYDGLPRLGMGNYAGSYAMWRRKIWDSGCRLADQGPFAGAGCGFEEAEFACGIYEKGFRCFVFNAPKYYHQRRDFERSGHAEEKKLAALRERRQWLRVRWPNVDFGIMHYHEQPPERHVRRVAVIYKATPHRPGPGGHLILALSGICIAQQFQPGEEPEGWDDYLFVDNGDYDYFDCPEHCHPSVFWAIDMVTPQQAWRPFLGGYVKRAETFDRIFAAQPCAVEHFREHDIEAEWLPLAANPDYHKPWPDEEIEFDWVALWHNVHTRTEYTELAREKFNFLVAYHDGAEYSRWLSRGRCAVNLSRSNEMTLRVFEVMMTEVPLVTDRARGLDNLFKEGEHYLGFDSPEELVEKIGWVQDHPGEARAMAKRARQEVLSKHTFYRRVLQIWNR